MKYVLIKNVSQKYIVPVENITVKKTPVGTYALCYNGNELIRNENSEIFYDLIGLIYREFVVGGYTSCILDVTNSDITLICNISVWKYNVDHWMNIR